MRDPKTFQTCMQVHLIKEYTSTTTNNYQSTIPFLYTKDLRVLHTTCQDTNSYKMMDDVSVQAKVEQEGMEKDDKKIVP